MIGIRVKKGNKFKQNWKNHCFISISNTTWSFETGRVEFGCELRTLKMKFIEKKEEKKNGK